MEEKYNVFNLRLNVLMVGAFLTERGMEFRMRTDDQSTLTDCEISARNC